MRTIPRWSLATASTAWPIMLAAAGGLSRLDSRSAFLAVPLVLAFFYGHLFFHGLRRTEAGRYGIVLWSRQGKEARLGAPASPMFRGVAPRLVADLLLGAFLALLLACVPRAGGQGQWLVAAEIFFPLALFFHRSLFYLTLLVDDGVGRPALALPRAVFFSAAMSLFFFVIVIAARRLALLV